MSDPILLRIPVGDTGSFGLAVVDRAAPSYADTWQGPAGKVLPTVAQADYATGSTTWQCQLTAAALTSSPNVTTADRAGTFCVPPGQTITAGEDTFQLEITAFQDAQSSTGLQAFLFANRTKEAFFYFSCDGPNGAPRAIGRVRLTSATFGGESHTDLSADIVLPLTRAPDIEFGSGATTVIVVGSALGEGAGTFGALSVEEQQATEEQELESV